MSYLRTLLRLLVALLWQWVTALHALLGRLFALVRAMLDRGQLPGRSARGADSRCVPVRHPAFRKPDPLIYAQYYLMGLGLAVTWDNPDITLRRGGVPVASSQVEPDTEYEIVARIWNGSTDAPIVGLPVAFSYLDFGMGAVSVPIGAAAVDLGVKGGPGCPAFAAVPWRTPAREGHYCIQVSLSWVDDANPLNNLGQENLVIGRASSPAVVEFLLRNDDDERRVFGFQVDAYQVPDPPPCEDIPRPSLRERRRQAVRPAAEWIYPVLDQRVRRRHDPAAHQLPEGWTIRFEPAEVPLPPGGQQQVRVVVDPPEDFVGVQRINVRGVDRGRIAGGITLAVER